MDLGEKLKKVRLDAGLSQRQVCGERITRNMLSQIENGSARPSMDTLRYLADRLGKPLGYFLDTDSDSLHAARLAYGAKDGLGMLDALSDTDLTTPEGAFLQKLGFLLAGEQALREQRLPYARDLLERCGQLESAYWQPETERRRQMDLCRATFIWQITTRRRRWRSCGPWGRTRRPCPGWRPVTGRPGISRTPTAAPWRRDKKISRRNEKSLPLEGKVVRLKPDRMRSKVTASYQPMVIIDSFDLISQP